MNAGFAFLAGFGTVWLLSGLATSALRPLAKWVSAVLVIAVAAMLMGFQPDRPLNPPAGAANPWEHGRNRFLVINVLQYAAIAVAVTVALRRRRADLIIVSISAIVGVHFLLLAPSGREPHRTQI
jgi:hypothetical protein